MAELNALIRVIGSRQKFHTPDHIMIRHKKIDFSQTFWENGSPGPQSDSTEGFACRGAGRRTMNLKATRTVRVSSPHGPAAASSIAHSGRHHSRSRGRARSRDSDTCAHPSQLSLHMGKEDRHWKESAAFPASKGGMELPHRAGRKDAARRGRCNAGPPAQARPAGRREGRGTCHLSV